MALISKAIEAASLRPGFYESVEADDRPEVLFEAMAIVVLSSVAAGIGAAATSPREILALAVTSMLGWFVWTGLTWFIGSHLLPARNTQVTIGQLLRTTGYSAAPGMLRALGFLPLVGWLVFFVANLWMLVAFVMAVRQALDYESWGRAILVCLIGWIVYSLAFWIFVIDLM